MGDLSDPRSVEERKLPPTSNTAKNGITCLLVVPNPVARRKRVQHS